MATLRDFVQSREFSSGEGFPSGDTFLTIDKTEIKEIETEWEGKKRTRFAITCEGRTYYGGARVMDGLKAVIKDERNFKKARITRMGEGKATTYTVVGVN